MLLTAFNAESARSQDTHLICTRLGRGVSRDRIQLPGNAIWVIEADVLAMGLWVFFHPIIADPCRV